MAAKRTTKPDDPSTLSLLNEVDAQDTAPSVLALLDEVEAMPEPEPPPEQSEWDIDAVLKGYLQLMKLARTPEDKVSDSQKEQWARLKGRSAFTAQELVRFIKGKPEVIGQYAFQKASDQVERTIGFKLVPDPADTRELKKNERRRQIVGDTYTKGSLLDLGLVKYVKGAGNKGVGHAFALDTENIRKRYSS